MLKKTLALCILLCLLPMACLSSESGGEDHWVTFLLVCNEGMQNNGGNVGNTLMLLSMNPQRGLIKQIPFLWDTFVEYPGYEMPQLLSQPFRVNGPEETLDVFNQNFGQNIQSFLSINFLNLASLIDYYGGITLDITRAERNALNGMVASKKETLRMQLQNQGVTSDELFDELFSQYYLLEYGPETRLSGIQAVGYGWLQYDSVANCCIRAARVISQLFFQIRLFIEERVVFYTDKESMPEKEGNKRLINAGNITEEDERYLFEMLTPIFTKSYTNLTDEQVKDIMRGILTTAYTAYEQNTTVFDQIQFMILPLENMQPRVSLGGVEGLKIDYAANTMALNQFMLSE